MTSLDQVASDHIGGALLAFSTSKGPAPFSWISMLKFPSLFLQISRKTPAENSAKGL
jgi:hypothetical protein